MNSKGRPYNFLPFRFERRGNGRLLLTHDAGDYYFLSDQDFNKFITLTLDPERTIFEDLKAKGFIYNNNLAKIIDLLAIKYRTKKRFLYDFTSLHMFVLTRRCNQECSYCHAASIDENSSTIFDMDMEIARKSVDLTFKSPAQAIKIEFQGGEPLLNFKTIKAIVEYAEELNQSAQKHLEFVLCTNTISLTENILDFIKEKNIFISTSLDGPREVHNACRKLRNGNGSYDIVSEKISWLQKEIGLNKVSALMTVTPDNLYRLNEVVDEYIAQNFDSIFLRMLNPFGRAYMDRTRFSYRIDEFVENYKKALEHIININLQGKFFSEYFATLLLSRILTPFSTGFVDLQSPAGTGISGVIYDFNGDVYVSDEARMLAATTGDKYFCLGNVNKNSWQEIFCGSKLKSIVSLSCIESIPGCAWCVYQSYCGGDPVRNHIETGDVIGKRPESKFCQKHKALFNIIFDYLENSSEDVQDVFWSWITGRKNNGFDKNQDGMGFNEANSREGQEPPRVFN